MTHIATPELITLMILVISVVTNLAFVISILKAATEVHIVISTMQVSEKSEARTYVDYIEQSKIAELEKTFAANPTIKSWTFAKVYSRTAKLKESERPQIVQPPFINRARNATT